MSGFALLQHDIRLMWRDIRGAFRMFGRRGFSLLIVVLALVMHAAAWPAVRGLATARETTGSLTMAAGVLFILLLMAAQALNGVTRALYGRGDLDLLFSSPISARQLLLVRALAIACGALASAAIFVVPITDVALITGDRRALALPPALAAGALAAVALGLVVAVGLFALVGPKRARLAAQIVATFMGGGFMLALQFDRLIPKGGANTSWFSGLGHWAGVLSFPVRAAAGEPKALAIWCLASVAAFTLATLGLGPLFLRQAMAASTAEGAKRAAPGRRRGRERAFSTDLAVTLRRKERAIILRDPWIVSQILLQLLYITPLFFVLWQGGSMGHSPVIALAPTVVVVCFQLAASLTWLGLSGEDAPELLATAPVPLHAVRRAKIQSVAGLVAVVAGPLLVWLGLLSPVAALATLALACFAGLSAIALNVWHARPTRRASFAARHRESKLLALVEMSMSMLLGITAALIAAHSVWTLAPLGIIVLILAANRPRAGMAVAA